MDHCVDHLVYCDEFARKLQSIFGIMKYIIDIDNTICYTDGSDYQHSQPDMQRIEKINQLFDQGHEIHYYTARGGNSGLDWSQLTAQQLAQWGAKHHKLIMGKSVYDVWVDDRAITAKDFFK